MGPSFSGSASAMLLSGCAASSGRAVDLRQFLWPKLGHWADFQSAQLHPGAAGETPSEPRHSLEPLPAWDTGCTGFTGRGLQRVSWRLGNGRGLCLARLRRDPVVELSVWGCFGMCPGWPRLRACEESEWIRHPSRLSELKQHYLVMVSLQEALCFSMFHRNLSGLSQHP